MENLINLGVAKMEFLKLSKLDRKNILGKLMDIRISLARRGTLDYKQLRLYYNLMEITECLRWFL